MQPVHRRAVCDGLPDRGDVQAARRHRRLRQGDLHRLQGVHGGLPVRRDLHQPRRPLGREVQHVRPSNRRGSRARLRLGVPDRERSSSATATTRHPRWPNSWRANPATVRRPEKETGPGVFYLGAHQATLDPLGSARPEGGLYAWATQGAPDPQLVTAGHPQGARSSAAALLSYDIPHHAPWGWRVSLYTWTKSIAAGAFLLAALHGADRSARLVGRGHPLGGSGGGAGLPRHHRGVADLGSQAPVALLPDLHQAPLVELVGQGRVHHRRLRRHRRAVSGGRRCSTCASGNRFSACSGSSSASRRRATPPTSSPRPRPETSGRARCCPRTSPCRPYSPGAATLLPFAVMALTGRRCARSRGGARGRRGRAPPPRLDGDEPAARHRPRRPGHP